MKELNLRVIEADVARSFWTRLDEMIEELEYLGYDVVEANGEYVSIIADEDDEDAEYILYLGYANTTMWVTRVRRA